MSVFPFRALPRLEDCPTEESDGAEIGSEKFPARRNSLSWFGENFELEGLCFNMTVPDANTLNEMMASDDNIRLDTVQIEIFKHQLPFATGMASQAFHTRTAVSGSKYAVKVSKLPEIDDTFMLRMKETMQSQALCKAFALEFNSLLEEEYNIDFIMTTGLQGKLQRCFSLEPYIPGTYVKYNSNCGYVKDKDINDPFNDAAQAFSHFTFERS